MSLVVKPHALQIARAKLLEHIAGKRCLFREQLLIGLFVVQIGQKLLTLEQLFQALGALVAKDSLFVFQVAVQPLFLRSAESVWSVSSSSAPLRENTLQSTMVPSIPGGQ